MRKTEKNGTKADKAGGVLADVAELAEALGVAENWVYANYKTLPYFRVGKYIRFDIDTVKQALAGKRVA